ncbi:MAG TPA: SDR family oxidoreductase [Gammaproteobacteria bacterium]
MDKIILAVGATSAIMQALLRLYAKSGSRFILLGRNEERLEIVKNDLTARGGEVLESLRLDFDRLNSHEEIIREIFIKHTGINTVIVGHGMLGNQQAEQQSFSVAEKSITANYLSYLSILGPVAEIFESRQCGSIIAISSVAGDRGRQSNYMYGSAKAGLDSYLAGLRNRLFKSKVKVLTVKPGFVDTPMTAGIPKNFLFVKPEKVARQIYSAEKRSRDVLYTPRFWRPIMMIICGIPEFVFKRLSL